MKRWQRCGRWVVLAVAVSAVGAMIWPFVLAHLQAVSILEQVKMEPMPWLVGVATAEPITREDVQFDTGQGEVRGRLYLPTERPDAPAMVILHGVHHLGIDEPRLEGFAAAMASCGIRVLTPELPDIKDYKVGQGSVRVIGDSARWFADMTGHPVGVMGLSFSGGLALLAASDPAYRSAIKFVLAVGAQDAMAHVANYYLTGKEQRPDGSTETLTPHEYGALVLEYEHLEDFVPATDVEAVRTVLRDHLYEDAAAEKTALAALNPKQVSEARGLMDSNSAGTRAMLARADEKHAGEMAGLSPEGKLKTLAMPVYLLHGEADNIVPSAETLWMASELPASSRKAVLVSPVLSHLDVEASPGWLDEWRLVHFFALVMRAAERD